MNRQSPSRKMGIKKVRSRPVPSRAKKEEHEFGLSAAGATVCPECQCVFYKKSWHPASYRGGLPTDIVMQSKLCPADHWKKERRYEGQLNITLRSSDPELLENVRNIIRNSDEQARTRDPMDRVLWTEETGQELKVHTSENQMAVRMGKKLKDAFRGSTLERKTSKEDIIRVYWRQ